MLRSRPPINAVHRSPLLLSHHSSIDPCHEYSATHAPCTAISTVSSSLSSCEAWVDCATGLSGYEAREGRAVGERTSRQPLLLHHNRPLDPTQHTYGLKPLAQLPTSPSWHSYLAGLVLRASWSKGSLIALLPCVPHTPPLPFSSFLPLSLS
jgi:hypothetical protein